MSVALARNLDDQGSNTTLSDTKDEKFNKEAEVGIVETNSELGFALEEKRFWFQRQSKYDPDAIATLVWQVPLGLIVRY
jgi:hypothetical protein